jgi:hypothetical protein
VRLYDASGTPIKRRIGFHARVWRDDRDDSRVDLIAERAIETEDDTEDEDDRLPSAHPQG